MSSRFGETGKLRNCMELWQNWKNTGGLVKMALWPMDEIHSQKRIEIYHCCEIVFDLAYENKEIKLQHSDKVTIPVVLML